MTAEPIHGSEKHEAEDPSEKHQTATDDRPQEQAPFPPMPMTPHATEIRFPASINGRDLSKGCP